MTERALKRNIGIKIVGGANHVGSTFALLAVFIKRLSSWQFLMRSISFCGNLVLKSLRSVLRTRIEQSIFTTKIFLKYILIKEVNSKTDCAKFCYKKITLIILNAKTRKTGWISAWSTQLTKGYFSKSTVTFSAKLYWRTKTFWKRSITR